MIKINYFYLKIIFHFLNLCYNEYYKFNIINIEPIMSHINSSNFIGQPLNENNNSSSPSSSSSQPHPLNGRHISAILDSHHLHTLMEKVASQEVPVLNQDV